MVENACTDNSANPKARPTLPATQSGIFSSEAVTRHRERFGVPHPDISTLVTMENADGLLRVCFMQEPGHRGDGVTGAVERLATLVYAKAYAASKPSLREVFSGKRGLRPDRFEVYVHIPPGCGIPESFSRVDMRFSHGRFTQARWTQLDWIPLNVQLARFETAPSGAPAPLIG